MACPAGYSADVNSAEGACTPCKPGFYRTADMPPSQPCVACPENTASPNPASAFLSDCACVPGTFKNSSMTSCQLCPAGSFSSAVGARLTFCNAWPPR